MASRGRGRPRCDAEAAIVAAWTTMTRMQLAAHFGVSLSSIYHIGRRQGLTHDQTRAMHGTVSRYAFGCRCAPCRMANAASARQWRARQRRGNIHPTRYYCDCGQLNCQTHPQPWMAS